MSRASKNEINNTMKMQSPIIKTLIHAALVLIATTVVSTSSAQTTVGFGDFNHDGSADMAAITSPTTITVSLANPDGSYTTSAILSVPKNRTITQVHVQDYNQDGVLDILAASPASGGWVFTYIWLGNGNGSFAYLTTKKWSWPPKGNYGSW